MRYPVAVDYLARQDGLVNDFTGLGGEELDLRTHTKREPVYQRSVWEYEQEWIACWMARREVSQPAGDCFREGVELVDVKPDTVDLSKIKSWIEGDLTPQVDGSINRTRGLLYYAFRTIEQGDKVGGAALYPIMDDGLDPSDPIDWRRIQRIVAWEVLDRSEIVPYHYDTTGAEPDYWILSDVWSRVRRGDRSLALKPGDVIHASRLWIHKGVRLGRREERARQWWGASVLDLNWDPRRAAEESRDYANTYADRASWIHLSWAGLNEMYSATDTEGNPIGRRLIEAKSRDFRRMARTLGLAVTDGGVPGETSVETGNQLAGRNPDTVESIVEGTGDLTKIHEMNRSDWQAGFGCPRSIAFGEQSSALRGGDNRGDWQVQQGNVDKKRNDDDIHGLVNWQLTILFASREGPTGGLIPRWNLRWRPLVVPSAMEKAEIAKAQADADNARIETGIATPEEVRQQRLVQQDVEGNLRAAEDAGDGTDVALPPAQVGIATAMLEGAMAVARGEISMPFFSGYLASIDEQRFSPAKAESLAAKAALARVDIEPETPAGAPTINAGTVLSAGGQVYQGKMAADLFEETLRTMAPEQFTQKVAERLRIAAEGGPDELAAAVSELGLPKGEAQPLAPAQPTADQATDLDGDGRPDPFAVLADIPDDLMTPLDIVEAIKRRTPLAITTRHVHALARKAGARSGRVGGVMGYSAGDIATAVAESNGLLPETPAEPDDGDLTDPA